MRRLIASEFVTLDGVMEAPGHDEHRDGKNAWALRYADADQQRYKAEELMEAGAVLLGRVTYEIFAAFWPTAPSDEGFADRMNTIPKYVVSRSLKTAGWQNTSIIGGNPAERIAELKQQPGDDILLVGSADLLNSLIPHDLIDEYRLMVFPLVLGSGKRLFHDATDITHLRLVDTRTFESGITVLTYQPADRVPSSRYVETFAWTQEQLRSWQAAQNPDRVLATVLFTDIVGSTEHAAALGDQGWRRLLDRHDRVARAEVERFRGRFVKSTGDGILATFDAPTRALRCAFGLNAGLAEVGLAIRSAIHTGEIEVRDDDIGGIGVHIAARALALAGDRQVVVTRTVRDLVTGTDLAFSPLGAVGLRGIPGEWELFAASAG
ncbi:MAG TPA: dihydrofolate reductase family protein [Actinomycetota bacterium]|jgi:class 3 adenylate cyclase/dihydrofolate reductase|nr:dihydrofolate reductase family protein [Actinomycetota bacterium]